MPSLFQSMAACVPHYPSWRMASKQTTQCLQHAYQMSSAYARGWIRCDDLVLLVVRPAHADPRCARFPGSTRPAPSHADVVHLRQYRDFQTRSSTLRCVSVCRPTLDLQSCESDLDVLVLPFDVFEHLRYLKELQCHYHLSPCMEVARLVLAGGLCCVPPWCETHAHAILTNFAMKTESPPISGVSQRIHLRSVGAKEVLDAWGSECLPNFAY
jgi:hypothetical protein